MTKQPVRVALVGIGGYGISYVNAMLDHGEKHQATLCAAIDPAPEKCQRLEEIKASGVRLYRSLDEFLSNDSADLLVTSTPIHLHAPQTCAALFKGINVLCEKPLAATIQEARAMKAAEEASGAFVAIGYQWSFTESMQALKQDIISGRFGIPLRLKTLVLWPRPKSYYARSPWAGALRSEKGEWILDSPINNACAHYLHNMFFVLGNTLNDSAMPQDVQAELYRANAIENFDTAALRCRLAGGAEILFYTSHAIPADIGPLFHYTFTKGSAFFDSRASNTIVGRFADGTTRNYGSPNMDASEKLWQCVKATTSGHPVACGIQTAMAHTLAVNGAQDSMPQIGRFPEELIAVDHRAGGDSLTSVQGLNEAMIQCYATEILPCEHGAIPWAKAGQRINLTNYSCFRG